jgi:hypothetical protein
MELEAERHFSLASDFAMLGPLKLQPEPARRQEKVHG